MCMWGFPKFAQDRPARDAASPTCAPEGQKVQWEPAGLPYGDVTVPFASVPTLIMPTLWNLLRQAWSNRP